GPGRRGYEKPSRCQRPVPADNERVMMDDLQPTSGSVDKTAASALCAWLDREVWLVTACAGERRGGLIATFVSQASLVPDLPRMVVGIARQHHTWGLIEASGAFALHLLGQDNLDWVGHFGLRSGG